MTDFRCPFCGSDKMWIETPYIDRITGKPKKTMCCGKQKTNYDFTLKRYSPLRGDVPSIDKIAKI